MTQYLELKNQLADSQVNLEKLKLEMEEYKETNVQLVQSTKKMQLHITKLYQELDARNHYITLFPNCSCKSCSNLCRLKRINALSQTIPKGAADLHTMLNTQLKCYKSQIVYKYDTVRSHVQPGSKVTKCDAIEELVTTKETPETQVSTQATLREESSQTNVILQYKLLASILSAVCTVIQQS